MSGLKHAALCLHALADTDRRWLLKELPSHHRAALEDSLREIRMLGIPKEPGVLSSLGIQLDILKGGDDTGLDRIRTVNAASPGMIFDVLGHEPHSLVAAVLASHAWSWEQEFLAKYGAKQRRSITHSRTSWTVGVPPRVSDSIICALAAKMRATANTSAMNPLRPSLDARK